jgi:hypothetical protein
MDDLIDRQAAIDAVQHAFDRETLLNRFARKVAVDALKTMPSAQPEQRWIPVSERLPDKPARYLVTNSRWGEYEVDWNIWINSRWLYNSDPIAWMPLPTAYKEVDA